jgi:flagellin FlaB
MHVHGSREEAFTGLEAAIVLIAFVVVAAVFSYVVLGVGFFTSQTAQAAVHSSVQQASSSIELVGNVYGIAPSVFTSLWYVNTTVALTAGGTPVDMSTVVISYNDGLTHWSNLFYDGEACPNGMYGPVNQPDTDQGHWCIAEKFNNSSEPGVLLGPNEQYVLAIQMPVTSTTNTQFTIYVQPAVGASLPIKRTVPPSIKAVQVLY